MSTLNQAKVGIFEPQKSHFYQGELPSHDGLAPSPQSSLNESQSGPAAKNEHLNGKSKHQVKLSNNPPNSATTNTSTNHSRIFLQAPPQSSYPQNKYRSLPNSSSSTPVGVKKEAQERPHLDHNSQGYDCPHPQNYQRHPYFSKKYSEENPSDSHHPSFPPQASCPPLNSQSDYLRYPSAQIPRFTCRYANPFERNEDHVGNRMSASLGEMEGNEIQAKIGLKNNNYNQKQKEWLSEGSSEKKSTGERKEVIEPFRKYFRSCEWGTVQDILSDLLNCNNNRIEKLIRFLESFHGRKKVKKSLKMFQMLALLGLSQVMNQLAEYEQSINKIQREKDKIKFLMKRLVYPLNTKC